MTKSFPEERQVYDDEISLVDLATTLIRRRLVMYIVFGGTVAIALIYAFFLMAQVREYTTLIQLGEVNDKTLEPAPSVIANIESHWYPELREQYKAETSQKLPFDITATNPENTRLIKLTSDAETEDADSVKANHQQLVNKLVERQTELLNRQKQELEERVASLQEHLDELSTTEVTGEAQAELIRQRASMMSEIETATARLDRVQPVEVLVVAREGAEPKGTSKTLILALAIVLGGMLGIFAAFLAEFISHVRKAMAEATPERT